MSKIIEKSIYENINLLDDIKTDLESSISKASKQIIKSLNNGKKILWCGNGGSASQADHLSAELLGGMYKKKKSPFRSICINTDTSFLTAWSNDDSYENIFTRQLEALGDPGDVLIVLSTSGNSKNVVNAANLAKKDNIKVISLTGNDGGKLKNISNVNINIPSRNTQRIQEVHILVGHILCDIVEQTL